MPVLAPRGPILDRNGTPLVTTRRDRIQIWPSDLPKSRYGELKRLSQLTSAAARDRARHQARGASDPLTPVTVATARTSDLVAYLAEHADEFPGVTTGRTYIRHYPYQSLAAQLLGYVGEISPGAAEALRRAATGRRPDRPGGRRVAYDSYLRGVRRRRRSCTLDALGRPRSALQTDGAAAAGARAPADADLALQEAAEQALALRHPARARRTGSGPRAAARSSRSTRTTARCSRSPRRRPTSRRVYTGRVTTKALAEQG